jgi:hypothetical protein
MIPELFRELTQSINMRVSTMEYSTFNTDHTVEQLATNIKKSIETFSVNLTSLSVLTEAATGNYAVTPVIAAVSGAMVYAVSKDSSYGSAKDAEIQTHALAVKMGVQNRIHFVRSNYEVNLPEIDILTNTGFNRPIDRPLIEKLSSKCVVPLMWEPWEYRSNELDLDSCVTKGIKVYGTNESDPRLETMSYIGYIIIKFLLDNQLSPKSSNVLLLGSAQFIRPVKKILAEMHYQVDAISEYTKTITSINDYSAIVFLENSRSDLLLGEKGYIKSRDIDDNQLLIHICGNVNFGKISAKKIPENPKPYGYMSYTCDFIDSIAITDLHAASLKVAHGMISANGMNLGGDKYRQYMVNNYPALAFDQPRLW